jgi:hypothetical protein
MTDDEYDAWVEYHCRKVAAPEKTAESLLECRGDFLSGGETGFRATAEELRTCTDRFVQGRRVPKFANEHAEAVASELLALRRERDAATRAAAILAPPDAPACRYCGDSGLVTLPHPRCVEVPHYDPPRLVGYPDRNRPFTDSLEISARCMECAVGRFSKSTHITTTSYLREIGGALRLIAVVALLDDARRAIAGRAWQLAPKGSADWTAALENIKRRVPPPADRDDAEDAA